MAVIPETDYEYEIARLVDAYKNAAGRIQRELERLDLAGLSRANAQVALSEVSRVLASLNDESAEWVAANIPQAARDGVARTLVALGAADTVEQAAAVVKFNRINANMVAAAVADTQADLLAVTQNVDRRVRAAVRKVIADSMRANMAAGISGRRTISADILGGLRKTLGDAVNTGIIDAAGRRWKPEVYVDTVVRTKMAETYREATTNEAIQRGAYYAVISRHGAKDACANWEGRIIKLSADAPGDYPTYDSAKATRQIWHPNCRHTFTPVRVPEK
ncbi:phage minor capsid protein [Paenibacillus elgii]|uniref:phage minor capsid protein n=1 Tax=Paenibacillus elgii TaxID=189691 RepID=UPI000248C30B|nr:phage minor capsid protein [Paenibacillus elgii]